MSDATSQQTTAPQPPTPDRNLLFGVLALQLEFIDERQFAQACSAWATRKDIPLPDLLQEMGWLADEDRHEVERLVERKLRKHGGDARRSLAEAAGPAARDAIHATLDEGLCKSVSSLPPATGYVLMQTVDNGPQQRSRYTLTRLHGEGGLGQVWVARDNDLERDVAFKQIRPERAGHPEMWRRFLKEAKITGQLEHPNIVPVYELGRDPGGQQPFYTMRLVRGQTLREAIADYHRHRKAGQDDPLARPKLLQAFVSVCQALNYAHTHGVIHRDLKPDNVILGRFGEVVVLDWGLAKVVGEAEESATRIGSAEEAQPGLTQAGQALGTPAYMAPEQAEGRIDLIDRRTDIYGLGAILFEVLTGQAPHRGSGTGDLLRRIAQAETPRARSVEPSVPRALEAICARAMAKSRDERYESAAAVAEDVQRWLADQPVTAYREPLRQRLGRKLRRHRSLVAGAAVVLLSVSVVSSVLAWLIYLEKNRAEAAERVAVAQREQISEEKTRAEAAEQVALAQSHLAIDALGDMVLEVQNELEDAPGAFLIRTDILNRAMKLLSRLNDSPATSDRVIRRHMLGHMQLGDVLWCLSERPKAHKEYLIALEFAEKAYKQNPTSDKVKGNVCAMQTKVGESEQFELRNFASALKRFEFSARGWGELTEKMRAMPQGDPGLAKEERLDLPECERAVADAYDHVGKIYYAEEDSRKRDAAKAEEWLTKSLEIRKRLFAANANRENRYRLGVSYLYLADNALKANDLPGTLKYNEELLKVRQAILKDRPTSLKAKRDFADAELRLGDIAYYAGQFDRAQQLYEDSLTWNEQVMYSEIESAHYRGRVCQSHYCIGCSALKNGDRQKALEHFRAALKIREALFREIKAKGTLDIPEFSTLMLTVARCEDHRRAAELAEEVRRQARDHLYAPRVLAEEVGSCYALCMAAVEAGRPLDRLTPDERKLRDRYHDLAIAAVKEGTAKGYNVILFLEGDPDHEPLRALPEYMQWLSEFKKGLKP
jgi:serine/threonine protein kinase